MVQRVKIVTQLVSLTAIQQVKILQGTIEELSMSLKGQVQAGLKYHILKLKMLMKEMLFLL